MRAVGGAVLASPPTGVDDSVPTSQDQLRGTTRDWIWDDATDCGEPHIQCT
ncbi:MAG TPA: hypothetical protein VGH67_17155 [Solirubrobacteraceae bacterium]|jgi:hypothetical protein